MSTMVFQRRSGMGSAFKAVVDCFEAAGAKAEAEAAKVETTAAVKAFMVN